MKQVLKSGLRRIGDGALSSGGQRSSQLPPTVERSVLLYVEDNRDNWEVTELQLRRRFDLRWAPNDEEACKVLKQEADKIAAVLMDIELQGSRLSGIDLTKLIRGVLNRDDLPAYARDVPVLPQLPIFIVTGYSAKYSEEELIAFGANRGLYKPVNFGELSMALSKLAISSRGEQTPDNRRRGANETRIAYLLVDNPRFHVHLTALAQAGLFAPRGFAGDLGSLTATLGKDGIDAAAIAISILEMIQTRSDATAYLTALVYRRAIACQLIAQRTAMVDVQRATAAGFLLDAGLLVRAMHDPAGALEIGMAPAPSRSLRERAGSEVEHPERIIEIAGGWDVPDDIVEAVRSHHADEAPTAPLARVAWVAEKLATVFETGDVVAHNAAALATGKILGLMTKDVEGLLEEIPNRVRLLGETTSIDLPAQTSYRELLDQASPALSLLSRAYRELQRSSEALIVEKSALTERLSQASERIAASHRKDLALIGAVQSMLLPPKSHVSSRHVELSAFYRAAEDCGGDWWWYEESGERLRIFVGDVSGHGAGSAMVTGAVASACRVAHKMSPGIGVAPLLQLLHNELWGMAHGEYHMTMLVMEIMRSTATIQLYSAAAPHVLFMAPDGKVTVAVTRGTPLGLPTDNFTIGRAEVAVQPGARIMCFTDGLYEFQTIHKQELGVKTLRKLLAGCRGQSVDDATRGIMRDVDALHPVDVAQEDDMTLVLFDVGRSAV